MLARNACVAGVALCLAIGHGPFVRAQAPPPCPVPFKQRPVIVNVANVTAGVDWGVLTDVAVADFDGDGRDDVAVAYFLSVYDVLDANVRNLTIFYNDGTTLVRGPDLNLFIPDYSFESKSVFYVGTGDIGLGDFDGDGDTDLAVAPLFGDELWFIENLGGRQFAQHLRFPFVTNSAGNFLTPPELLAADFNGDGRDDLVYLCDPQVYIGGRMIHFWSTSSNIGNIRRVDWHVITGQPTQYTRALAVDDFNDDGRPDLCYTGSINPPQEDDPILTWWYDLNLATLRFSVHDQLPAWLCSDVVAVRPDPWGPAGVILTDLDGMRMQYWARTGSSVNFELVCELNGFAGQSPGRGMAAVVADIDDDGDPDLITRQRCGDTNRRQQIQIALCAGAGATWTHLQPNPIDTLGLRSDPNDEILRPRNLDVGDLFGNTLPEIVAGFGPNPPPPNATGLTGTLDLAIWLNGCRGDVNRDNRVDGADLAVITPLLGLTSSNPAFDPEADLDKDGRISDADLLLSLGDFGCRCPSCCGRRLADTNCDGVITVRDVDGLSAAMSGPAVHQTLYPGCPWLNADCNGDNTVNWHDVDVFLAILTAMHSDAPPPGFNLPPPE